MPNSRPIHNTNVYVLCRRPAFYVQGVWGSMSQYMFKATSALRTPCRLLYTAVMRSLGSEIRRRGGSVERGTDRLSSDRGRAAEHRQQPLQRMQNRIPDDVLGAHAFSHPGFWFCLTLSFSSLDTASTAILCERAKGWFRAVVL